MSTVASEIARSNDVFIKHNFDNHDGEVSVWAAVEVLSFGTLSKIIKNLKTGTGSSYSIWATNYQYKSKKEYKLPLIPFFVILSFITFDLFHNIFIIA